MAAKYFGDAGAWWDAQTNTTRAVISGAILVLALAAVPLTRRYSGWAGAALLVIWLLKFYKKKGGF